MELDGAQKDLRERFFREATEAVRGLTDEQDILAAILTGSAAWGKPNPDGDLDILLITRGRSGVMYRYLIPTFCPVRRRTELGYIPYETAVRTIAKGYATRISCSMIEQLKNGRILFERDSFGTKLIRSSREVQPAAATVGKMINDAVSVAAEIDGYLELSLFEEAALATGRLVQRAARIMLLARERVGISKEKHEYRAVRRRMSGGEAGRYEELMNIRDVTGEAAGRAVDGAIDIVAWLLRQRSISTKLVHYEKR